MEVGSIILVANAESARFLRFDGERGLMEVLTLINPTSHLKNGDLVSSPPGRSFQSVGVRRSALEKSMSPKQKEDLDFARRVAHELKRGDYSGIYLVAEPRFLGLLRAEIDGKTGKAILGESNKDFSLEPVERLWPRLKELFVF